MALTKTPTESNSKFNPLTADKAAKEKFAEELRRGLEELGCPLDDGGEDLDDEDKDTDTYFVYTEDNLHPAPNDIEKQKRQDRATSDRIRESEKEFEEQFSN